MGQEGAWGGVVGGWGGGGMGRRKGQRESDEKIRGSNKEGENTRKIKRNKKKKAMGDQFEHAQRKKK